MFIYPFLSHFLFISVIWLNSFLPSHVLHHLGPVSLGSILQPPPSTSPLPTITPRTCESRLITRKTQFRHVCIISRGNYLQFSSLTLEEIGLGITWLVISYLFGAAGINQFYIFLFFQFLLKIYTCYFSSLIIRLCIHFLLTNCWLALINSN